MESQKFISDDKSIIASETYSTLGFPKLYQ